MKKDGSTTSSTDEALERLQEYYSELLNRSPKISINIDSYLAEFARPTNWTLDSIPTIEEFSGIIKHMKNHKATSVDPTPIEIYKYGDSAIFKLQMFNIFLESFSSSVMPALTLQTVLCSLFKGEKKESKGNNFDFTFL